MRVCMSDPSSELSPSATARANLRTPGVHARPRAAVHCGAAAASALLIDFLLLKAQPKGS